MSEPLFNFDPVKFLKRLLGLEEPTPQEQQAETQIAEEPATPSEISPAEAPAEAIEPLPNAEPLPTVQEAPAEAVLQPTPPPNPNPPNVNPPQTPVMTPEQMQKKLQPREY